MLGGTFCSNAVEWQLGMSFRLGETVGYYETEQLPEAFHVVWKRRTANKGRGPGNGK